MLAHDEYLHDGRSGRTGFADQILSQLDRSRMLPAGAAERMMLEAARPTVSLCEALITVMRQLTLQQRDRPMRKHYHDRNNISDPRLEEAAARMSAGSTQPNALRSEPMTTRPRKRRAAKRTGPSQWQDLDDASLLRLRFRDLRLKLEDSLIGPDVERLYSELERRGIRFKPHVWLSTEWFSPDGVPGIAVPFFAAHPRLRRLERKMMGEVEGGNHKWRMRILRHEAGHALDTAYRLRRRADWRNAFGYASKPYPRNYRVRPGSRAYVLHIGYWYAQSHPTEDFAETFAVWMQPKARWRREYEGWPALGKLEYVDRLMEEISGQRPVCRDRQVVAPLSQNNRTLGEHYRRRMAHGDHVERRYDQWLGEIFVPRTRRPRGRRASRFIRSMTPQLRRLLLKRTPAGPYLVDHAIETITQRVRQLNLVVIGSRRENERRVVWLHEDVIYDVLRRNSDYFVL